VLLRPTWCATAQADVWLDADLFEQHVLFGDQRFEEASELAAEHYRSALVLYHGDYLQAHLYEDWCSEERERLLTLYLRTAERVAGISAEQGAWEDVVEVSQAILARDNCWEQAYRMLMRAYVELGNRAQALRVYQRCEATLQDELDIEPSLATQQLAQELFNLPRS
jgi:DNA-binding SARP family transcriptional activator